MSAVRKVSAKTSGDSAALDQLLRAIGAGERDEAMSILATSPALAVECTGAGATRTSATAYFLLRPRRYIYAGDTALHIAAAVYDIELGEHLLIAGADATIGNRRGATPLHAASSGNPSAEVRPTERAQPRPAAHTPR